MRILLLVLGLCGSSAFAQTNQYLFIGHTRSDFQTVVWPFEHVRYDLYDTVMLGGDYLWNTTVDDQSMRYMDAIYDLDHPATLIAYGNHDDASGTRFKNFTGREFHYAFETNGVQFVVLNTEDDVGDISAVQLTMLESLVSNAVHDVTNITDMVLIQHRILWMVDVPELAHLMPLMAATTQSVSDSNWYDAVHPLLVQAEQAGIQVICLAGDRTNVNVEYVRDGVTYLGSGIKEEFPPTNNFVVTLTQDVAAGTMDYAFNNLNELPTDFPPIVFSEIHFQPGDGQSSSFEFLELYNFGDAPYDLNGCQMIAGVVFAFTNTTVLAPGEFLLLARDADRYTHLPVPVFEWEAGNNLSNTRELVALVDPSGRILDAVSYDNKTGGTDDPWQREPFGDGPTLELLDARLDNVWPVNWRISEQTGGTPGERNFSVPELGQLGFDAGSVITTWNQAVSGVEYALEASASLSPPDWQVIDQLTAGADALRLTNAVPADLQYYRLRRVFP